MIIYIEYNSKKFVTRITLAEALYSNVIVFEDRDCDRAYESDVDNCLLEYLILNYKEIRRKGTFKVNFL